MKGGLTVIIIIIFYNNIIIGIRDLRKLLVPALFLAINLFAENGITLQEAIQIIKSNNLEIRIAELNEAEAKKDADIASGYHWGKLDFTQNFARSDDAGNVFGFKLASREATFGDFGFDEFLGGFAQVQNADQLIGALHDQDGANRLLATEPEKLNDPDARSYFQSKVTYQIPLYAGGKIVSYTKIAKTVARLKNLDKEKVVQEKIYEIRKSFYDMALLNETIKNLNVILNNIKTLEKMVNELLTEGYAKNTDKLEIEAKKSNVKRLKAQMEANKKLLYHYISFLLNQEVNEITTPEVAVIQLPNVSVDEVIQENLDVKKAKTGLNIYNEMISVAKAGYLPEVGAFAELQTADDTFLGDASDHKSYTVGVRLTWNIYNGGIDSANIEKSKVQKMKMKRQIELAKKGISLQFRKIMTQIESYDAEIESLEKEFGLANEIYKTYEAKYQENLVSINDVLIKQSYQIQKIMELLRVKNLRNERVFALEKLINKED